MSVHVISWVLKHSPSTLGDRLVLLSLADKAEEDGTEARPSVATLALEARLSARQVQRCLRNLEGRGEIEKTGTYRYPGQRHGVNVYRVAMKGDNLSPLEVTKGDMNGSQRVTPTSPNPSLEPVLDQTLAAAPRVSRNHPMWDPIWDKLTEGFGPATTKDAQSRRAKAVKALVEAGATPEDVIVRGKRWRRHFPGATLTQEALVKWWDTLPRKELR
jgi:hypothetical protein